MTGRIKSNSKLTELVKMMGDDNKIVTPRLTKFLLDNVAGITYDQWVIDRVMSELMKPKRERRGTFSASSAADCPRQQVFAFLGVPGRRRTDVQLQNMGNDGTWRHARYQANLLQAAIIDDIEYELPWASMRSKGSVDGVGTVPLDHPRVAWRGKPFGLELKGAFSFKAQKIVNEGPHVYLKQVWRYMLVSGLPMFSIVVENRDSLQWVEYVYETDPASLADSRADLVDLNQAVDRKRLPDRLPECEMKTGAYKECPHGGVVDSPCMTISRWPSKSQITMPTTP